MNQSRHPKALTVYLMPEKFALIWSGTTNYVVEDYIGTTRHLGDLLHIKELTMHQGSTSTGFMDLEVTYGWKWQETGRIIEARVTHLEGGSKGINLHHHIVSFKVITQYNERTHQNNIHRQGVAGTHGQQGYRGTEWEPEE